MQAEERKSGSEEGILFLLKLLFPFFLKCIRNIPRLIPWAKFPKVSVIEGLFVTQNHHWSHPPERNHGKEVCGKFWRLFFLLVGHGIGEKKDQRDRDREREGGVRISKRERECHSWRIYAFIRSMVNRHDGKDQGQDTEGKFKTENNKIIL